MQISALTSGHSQLQPQEIQLPLQAPADTSYTETHTKLNSINKTNRINPHPYNLLTFNGGAKDTHRTAIPTMLKTTPIQTSKTRSLVLTVSQNTTQNV